MIAAFSNRVRTVVGTLCVALALVFAGVSATSVVDQIQHAVGVAHDHHHGGFNTIVDDDHDQPAAQTNVAQADEAGALGLHGAGLGHHHHMDGPSGFVGGDVSVITVTMHRSGPAMPASDALARGPTLAGLERPPKA